MLIHCLFLHSHKIVFIKKFNDKKPTLVRLGVQRQHRLFKAHLGLKKEKLESFLVTYLQWAKRLPASTGRLWMLSWFEEWKGHFQGGDGKGSWRRGEINAFLTKWRVHCFGDGWPPFQNTNGKKQIIFLSRVSFHTFSLPMSQWLILNLLTASFLLNI